MAELGWLHVGERYYDPALGRFVQRDPIGIGGGRNVYEYAGNNPLSSVDPLGLSTTEYFFDHPVVKGVGVVLCIIGAIAEAPIVIAVGTTLWGGSEIIDGGQWYGEAVDHEIGNLIDATDSIPPFIDLIENYADPPNRTDSYWDYLMNFE